MSSRREYNFRRIEKEQIQRRTYYKVILYSTYIPNIQVLLYYSLWDDGAVRRDYYELGKN